MQSRAMKLSKQFQLAYDVHMCRMIPQLVIILEGEMCTSDSDKLRHDQKCKNMKRSQDMQLIQKLRDDQKRMKKVFEVMSGRNIVTNSRVTPSWREIVSLTFSEAGVLHMAEQDIPPPTITAMKIPIIRKGEYDIWSMRMRQYICHTDHNLWDVIVNGDLEEEPAPTGETSAPPAPKTAKQLAAKRNQERVKSILLLAIPDEYLLKFHNVADAKSL
ncbi:hypothetical protein Tco_0707951 [Tanacetum coccineum]